MVGRLKIGDTLRLSGGHELEPPWYGERKERIGVVQRFIPGQNRTDAVVVALDEPIVFDGVIGQVAVLELRFVGARWGKTETVHIELCDFEPEEKTWKDRRQGKWIESHATYKRIEA